MIQHTISWVLNTCSRNFPNGVWPDCEASSLSQSGGHASLGTTPSLLLLNSLLLLIVTAKSFCTLYNGFNSKVLSNDLKIYSTNSYIPTTTLFKYTLELTD